ncbi:MAG: hypothetical protein K9G38_05755 [Bacteroidales bacterium]|nr:hypothetical protein [Bacteroidales bacterium]
MVRPLITTLLLAVFFMAEGQEGPYRYTLVPGESYYLAQELKQNTETDNRELIDPISLDLRSRVVMTVASVTDKGHYNMVCHYQDLRLSFFAPGSDLFISSEDRAFSPLKKYLKTLEDQPFEAVMTAQGEVLSTGILDSLISSLCCNEHTDTAQQAMLLGTVGDAFGEQPFSNLVHIALNVYHDTVAADYTRPIAIFFNGGPLEMRNKLYVQPAGDDSLRIQGVGVLRADKDTIRHGEVTFITTLNGQQTYDYLFSSETGWMIEGVSKQKIRADYTLTGHAELPEGLTIPAVTLSEYVFRGGRVTGNKKGKR